MLPVFYSVPTVPVFYSLLTVIYVGCIYMTGCPAASSIYSPMFGFYVSSPQKPNNDDTTSFTDIIEQRCPTSLHNVGIYLSLYNDVFHYDQKCMECMKGQNVKHRCTMMFMTLIKFYLRTFNSWRSTLRNNVVQRCLIHTICSNSLKEHVFPHKKTPSVTAEVRDHMLFLQDGSSRENTVPTTRCFSL